MKKAASLLLLFLVVISQLIAQEFPKNETNNIRIDPFQWNAIDANEFCWAYDVVYDKKGSTISVGYLRGYINDTSVHLASDNCGSFCSDKLYIAKHDKTGKRQWINSAIGNIRPTAVRINKHGDICVAGSFYGKLPLFLGTHQTQATDSSATTLERGFFITLYKSTGEITACKIVAGMELFAFELDDEDNFYLGGCEEFRTSKEWSLVRRKLKLQRINKDLTVGFTLVGDTLGDSHINSISMVKKQLMVMFTYSDTCNTPYFKLGNNYVQQGALIHFTTDGTFIRVQREVNGQLINPGIAVVDKDMSVYLATGGYNHPQHLLKLDATGKLVWQEMITKPSTNIVTKLLLHDDELLICGYGYGALFGANSTQQYAYKAKTSTDFFIASYTKTGQVNWLKAGGDQGTEYCQSIAVYKDELCAFGFVAFGGKLTFNQLSLNTRNTLWLAKFKLDSLAYMNVWKPNPVVTEVPLFSVKETDCSCTIRSDGNEKKFMPSVGSFIDDEVLEKYFSWKMDSSYQLNRNAFLFNFYAQPSHDESYYTFKLYTVKPFKLVHPKKLYTLNLTPCVAEEKWNNIPISLSISNGIKKYNPSFDSDKFDSSLFAVYDVLRTINNTDMETLLQHALDEGDGYFDYDKWITHINKTYHLGINKKFTDVTVLVQHILQQLEVKQMDADSFLVNTLIKTGKTTRSIKPEEWQKLCNLFEANFDRNLDNLYVFVYPSFNASASPKFVEYELHPNTLCAWNDIQRTPELQGGKRKPTTILGQCSEFELNSIGINSFKISKWYHHKCNISGTSALLKIKQATYINPNMEYNTLYAYEFSKLLRDSFAKPMAKNIDGMYVDLSHVYSPLLTNFDGLMVNEGNVWIPIGNEVLKSNIRGLIVNNNLIAGTVEIPIEVLENGSWKIGAEQSALIIKPTECYELLKNVGFDNITIKHNHTTLIISFLKRPTYE